MDVAEAVVRVFVVPVLAGENTNSRMCGQCGGLCCKRQPGGLVPQDVQPLGAESMEESLVAMLKSGRYVIDLYVGDPFKSEEESHWSEPDVYFVRPAKEWHASELTGMPASRCTFLKQDGCELQAQARPYECKALVPDMGLKCGYGKLQWEGKRSLAKAWWPHQAVLKELMIHSVDEFASEMV